MKKKAIILATLAAQLFAFRGQAATPQQPVVNINTATVAQLEFLPDVGAKRAAAIVDYRSRHPFFRVADIRQVKGFGDKRTAELLPYLAVSGPTTATTKIHRARRIIPCTTDTDCEHKNSAVTR